MRTTLIIDDELMDHARKLSGLEEKTAVVHAALRTLIATESAKRLAALAGSEPALRPVRRRRPAAVRPTGRPIGRPIVR